MSTFACPFCSYATQDAAELTEHRGTEHAATIAGYSSSGNGKPGRRGEPMTTADTDTKTCPRCAEDVKREAQVCRHCNHAFSKTKARGNRTLLHIAGVLIFLYLLWWAIAAATGTAQ